MGYGGGLVEHCFVGYQALVQCENNAEPFYTDAPQPHDVMR